MHLPADPTNVARLREPTPAHPWRVLVSGCMTGTLCGWDGTDNGMGRHALLQAILGDAKVQPVPFCPEHLAMGTPRGVPDIHGGDGFDVLDGTARVIVDSGPDVTDAIVRHATAMATLGETCDLAILVDISGTCGSQVISLGDRNAGGVHQAAPAVVAALLWRRHIPFTSQRDWATLARLADRLGVALPEGLPDRASLLDHHQHPWVREHLPHAPWSTSERGQAMRPPVSEREPVFKVLGRKAWDARAESVPWAPIDVQDGFVHLSTASQLDETLAKHFAGRDDLVIVQLDAARLANLVWERSRGGALFPHVYGDVPLSAVVATR